MKIKTVLVTPDMVEKILFKNGIHPSQVDGVLRQKHHKTYFEKVKNDRYLAIGRSLRGYITVLFDYLSGTGEIASARFSNISEKRKYKRKMR